MFRGIRNAMPLLPSLGTLCRLLTYSICDITLDPINADADRKHCDATWVVCKQLGQRFPSHFSMHLHTFPRSWKQMLQLFAQLSCPGLTQLTLQMYA